MAEGRRAGSLFSGVGGIDLALERAGWEIRWQVENDPAACRVLEHHWPGVKRYGDITEVDCGELEPVDLIVGGWPCQDNSVAGKRAGLAGERSGLFREVVRIARALAPHWLLLENVPGLRSLHQGRDMATVLRALGELGFWWAYRSLDAQYDHLAQRRERLFFVCDSRDPGGPVKVLFESESCAGDPPPSREAGQRAAYTLAASARGTGDGHGNAWNSNYVPLMAAGCVGSNGAGIGESGDPAMSLDTTGAQSVAYQCQGTNVGEMGTLRRGNGHVTGGVPFVSQPLTAISKGGWRACEETFLPVGMAVRRLLPIETLRLQGLPDSWLDLDPPLSDSVKYRLVGNSVAVPVVQWVAERLRRVAEEG